MADMKLYVLSVGWFMMNKGFVCARCKDADKRAKLPHLAYLIDHPKGKVLVDLGQSYEMRDENTVMEPTDSVVHQLSLLGYRPEDIDYVVLTHMHLDHVGYMNEFKNATFIVRKEELKAAWWPEACEGGYVWPLFKDTRFFKYIQPADGEDYDIFMDGSIVLFDTQGHSRGHQSVALNLPESGKLVIVGDACPLLEGLDSNLLPGTCTDNWAAIRALDKLRHMEACGYKLLFAHDPDNLPEKLAPDFYA